METINWSYTKEVRRILVDPDVCNGNLIIFLNNQAYILGLDCIQFEIY